VYSIIAWTHNRNEKKWKEERYRHVGIGTWKRGERNVRNAKEEEMELKRQKLEEERKRKEAEYEKRMKAYISADPLLHGMPCWLDSPVRKRLIEEGIISPPTYLSR
jgi:hypothetical protein